MKKSLFLGFLLLVVPTISGKNQASNQQEQAIHIVEELPQDYFHVQARRHRIESIPCSLKENLKTLAIMGAVPAVCLIVAYLANLHYDATYGINLTTLS